MSILSGIGQIPPVFGSGSGGSFSPIEITCDVVQATGGQIDGGYIVPSNTGVVLEQGATYFYCITIPLFSLPQGENIDVVDVILQIQLNQPPPSFLFNDYITLVPDYININSTSTNSQITITGLFNCGQYTYLAYVNLIGSYTPNTIDFDYGGGKMYFIKQ